MYGTFNHAWAFFGFFFSSTFVLNRFMSLDGGVEYWFWWILCVDLF
jgi:hypothetical protein